MMTPGSARRSTINDVAHAAGVSRQTVSNVVNRPERVATGTRSRVEAAITRLGYRPSSAAKSLREQRAGAIGIELNALGSTTGSETLYPFLVELSLQAREHDSHMVTFGSRAERPATSAYESMVRARLVDAFVFADTHVGDPRPAYLRAQSVPFATFGRVWDDPSFTAWADVDGHAGVMAAIDHLSARGYRKIGFLGWPAGSPVGDDRRRGWRDGCGRHGLYDASLAAETTQSPTAAMEAARPLIEAVGRGGAIVCVSDLVALGARQAAQELGLTVGSDLGLVGFDGTAIAELYDLTTIEQPLADVAAHLLSIVTSQLAGGPPPSRGALLAPSLVVRSSTSRTVAAPTPKENE